MSVMKTIAVVAASWVYGGMLAIGVVNGIRIGQLASTELGWCHAITFAMGSSFLFIPAIQAILEDES